MTLFKKLFGKNKPKGNGSTKSKRNNIELKWVDENESPWKVRVLDLRPIALNMVSTSVDKQMAANSVSYGQEDGLCFADKMPKSDKEFDTDLKFKTDGILQPGVLFNPGEMEHKWAIYFHDNKLIFVRSWLREVFVIAQTTQKDNELHINKIIGEFTENESESTTKAILMFLMLSHGMQIQVPAPLPDELKDELYQAGLWAFSTFGNMAITGVFNNDFNYHTDVVLRTHSLFHIAVARGDIEDVNKYLNDGVDINLLAADGLSALQWSLAADISVLEHLLAKGADPNFASAQGATPIMNAVQSNLPEALDVLLKNKAEVNAQDNRGFTALHRAAEMGHEEILATLLENGADKTIEAEGHTALSLAKFRKRYKIIELLEQ